MAKDKNSLFSYYKQLKSDFVEPFLLSGSVIKKIDFINTIVSKCIRDKMSPFADASRS